MKALAILLGLASAGGISWAVYERMKRKDDINKLKAAFAMGAKAVSPTSEDAVFTPPGAGVGLLGAYGVERV
jgi:hypothetical protein